MPFCCCLPSRKGPLHDTLISPQPGGAQEAAAARRSISQQGLMLGHSSSCPDLQAAADGASNSNNNQPVLQQQSQQQQQQQPSMQQEQQQEAPGAQTMPQLSPRKSKLKGGGGSSNISTVNPVSSKHSDQNTAPSSASALDYEGIELKPAEANPHLGVDHLTSNRGLVKARPGS